MDEVTEEQQSARDDATVAAFIERFAAEMAQAGMQRMAGRVFACLLADDAGVLTSAQLAERLQISPAAVSGAVRYLTQVGMIGREREPGSRRERYRLHNDQWYQTFTRRDEILRRWEITLKSGIVALGPGTAAGQRIEETADFFEFLQREMSGIMHRWAEHRAAVLGP